MDDLVLEHEDELDVKDYCVEKIQFLNCTIPFKNVEFHRLRIKYKSGGWSDYYYLDEIDFESLQKG